MDTLAEKVGKIIEALANNQIAKDRFDIGEGYKELDYRKTLYLDRLLVSEDPEVVEKIDTIKSKLNHLKNQYL